MQKDLDIRFLNKREYELSKTLWMECFEEDGEAFVDWYYSERSKPKYVLGAFDEKEQTPIAMMHLIPVDMRFDGAKRRICFVTGVCTKPSYRGKGICGMLFERAFEHMKEKGYDATVLQPFDTAFYERFGYMTYIVRNEIALSDERLNAIGRTLDNQIEPDPELLSRLYRKAMHGYSGCSVRGRAYFRSLIHEYSLEGAKLVVTESGCCAGYAEGENGSIFRATEIFFLDGTDPLSLLPKGFSGCVFPLPMDMPVPEGCESRSVSFSMLKPLKPDVDFFSSRCFGFDRY